MNSAAKLKDQLDKYIKNTYEVRKLSMAHAEGIGSAKGYYRDIRDRNQIIKGLFSENKEILDTFLYPIINSEGVISDEVVEVLTKFTSFLLNPWPVEDLDLSLAFTVERRLFDNALFTGNDEDIVRQSNLLIYAAYYNMNRVNRVKRPENELISFYQHEGLRAADTILSYLEHDRYLKISNVTRRKEILGQARFFAALYDTYDTTDETINDKRIDALVKTLEIADDPFYIENTPGNDWDRYRLRSLEHMGQLTENGNAWKLTREQCARVYGFMKLFENIWSRDEARSEKIVARVHYELIVSRNAYYSGFQSLEEYRKNLLAIYEKYTNADYDMYSIMANIYVPIEYLATVSQDNAYLVADVLSMFYARVKAYILGATGEGSFSFFMEYIVAFLDRFIELKGGMSIESMSLSCMAALHPASYVESCLTADVSMFILKELYKNKRSLFESYTIDETFYDKLYHCAMNFSVGNLYMMDTCINYARELTDDERFLIDLHPLSAFDLLNKHESTRPYSHIILEQYRRYHMDGNYQRFDARDMQADDDLIYRIISTAKSMDKEFRNTTEPDESIFDLLSAAGSIGRIERFIKKRKAELYINVYELLMDIREGTPADFDTILDEFVKRTARIRILSSPKISDIDDADSYEEVLTENFTEIRNLAEKNRDFLENILYPMIESSTPLSDGEASSLFTFCRELVNGQQLGDLDCQLFHMVSGRLLEEAEKKDDQNYLIRQLDMHIIACYELAHQSKRMKSAVSLLDGYRLEGLEVARKMAMFLEKDKFQSLTDPASRKLVLMHSRYDTVMYEIRGLDKYLNKESLETLRRSLELCKNSLYADNYSEKDWNYHNLRALEYIGQETECGNTRGFEGQDLVIIANYMDDLEALWKKDVKGNSDILDVSGLEILLSRNRFLSGRIGAREYRKWLLDIYDRAEERGYDFYNVLANVLVPLEYLMSFELNKDEPDGDEYNELLVMYEKLLSYALHATGVDNYSLMLEYFAEILYHFREIEGVMTFEEMGLRSLAALHPPTYVHSRMVADISRLICEAMIDMSPSAFDGCLYSGKGKDISKNRESALDYIYHAAVCHDFGKLPMIDTISVYGRKLFDSEFALLKHHPQVGADMLLSHESTKRYADAALSHHLWYDGSRGYPDVPENSYKNVKVFIDIISIADSIDAATDTIGRSYATGKSIDTILEEIIAGSGSRYSDVVGNVITLPEVKDQLSELLKSGRRANYKNAYTLLKEW